MLTNVKKIQHLYWRAGFGILPKELKNKRDKTLNQLANQLISNAKTATMLDISSVKLDYEEFRKIDKKKGRLLRKGTQRISRKLSTAWVQQMVESTNPLLERMTLFWHGHFACINKINPFMTEVQNNTIRTHALGNFKDLVLAISKDPAMIHFL